MPSTQFAFKEKYRYQNGFNSYHEYGFPLLPRLVQANGIAGPKQ